MSLTNVKIVADSSSDVLSMTDIPFASAPLKIITSEKEYTDNTDLDVAQMVEDLQNYKGRSSTSCPSPSDWVDSFGDAQYIFCVSITSALSGCYNSAVIAKNEYESNYPQRRVFVIDSLSTGPEMQLIIEKLREYIKKGYDFDEICEKIMEYKKHTGLIFMLESMKNLANNGRVSPIVAKAAGLLGIRVVGKASAGGELEPLEKCRGEKKALSAIVEIMKNQGAVGGRVLIGHCFNDSVAKKLKELIEQEFENVRIRLYRLRGLCSFYAEKGGILIGFEKA